MYCHSKDQREPSAENEPVQVRYHGGTGHDKDEHVQAQCSFRYDHKPSLNGGQAAMRQTQTTTTVVGPANNAAAKFTAEQPLEVPPSSPEILYQSCHGVAGIEKATQIRSAHTNPVHGCH